MRGPIRVTDMMYLESNERHWRLLTNGYIEQLETSALIIRSEFSTVRIHLIITQIFPPENQGKRISCQTLSDNEAAIINGINRISEFVYNFFEKEKWILVGHIKGEIIKPIIIAHYPIINLTVYTVNLATSSQKLTSQNLDNSFQPFFSLN